MSYEVYQNLILYRLPGATFPLQFTFWERQWRLETAYVEGAGHWRCMIEGPQCWYVCSGHNQIDLEKKLTETGIEIPSRTFPGTVFRFLYQAGIAQKL